MNQPNKPKRLDGITALMALLNLGGFSMITDDESTRSTELIIISILIAFSFWILYKFNKGLNWARILVLITSVIALLNLIVILDYSIIAQIVILVEATLAIYLFYWLNTESVKKYFVHQNKEN
jgi:hypothetical protein